MKIAKRRKHEEPTVHEVAQFLTLHRQTVNRMIEGSQLPALKAGRAWRLNRVQIKEWVKSRQLGMKNDIRAGCRWLKRRNDRRFSEAVRKLTEKHRAVGPSPPGSKSWKWRLAFERLPASAGLRNRSRADKRPRFQGPVLRRPVPSVRGSSVI